MNNTNVCKIARAVCLLMVAGATACVTGLISLNGASVRYIMESNPAVDMGRVNLYIGAALLFFTALAINARNIEAHFSKEL